MEFMAAKKKTLPSGNKNVIRMDHSTSSFSLQGLLKFDAELLAQYDQLLRAVELVCFFDV
jgi:hypothetical protein